MNLIRNLLNQFWNSPEKSISSIISHILGYLNTAIIFLLTPGDLHKHQETPGSILFFSFQDLVWVLLKLPGMLASVRQETFYAIPTNYAIGKFVSQAFQEWLHWFIFSVVCLNKISPNTSFLRLFPFKALLTSAAFTACSTSRLLLRWSLLHKQPWFWR